MTDPREDDNAELLIGLGARVLAAVVDLGGEDWVSALDLARRLGRRPPLPGGSSQPVTSVLVRDLRNQFGLEPTRRHGRRGYQVRRILYATRSTAVAVYRDGCTFRQVASVVGVDEATVRRWVRQAGVPIRSRGPRRVIDPVAVRRARQIRKLSWSQVAAEVGASKTGVQKAYRAAQKV